MTTPVIRARDLAKRYRIGEREPYKALRDVLAAAVTTPLRALRGRAREPDVTDPYIWALRGVSFDIHPGEVVGIIGRNGVGKTTLLKILARITKPTEGEARVTGALGSLLEVGTGFHPELTGRENVYLNGAILGMRKAEIDRKFDEIVAFSGVERFIDTPVKRFSTGMQVRLAFSVAAHLEPEILLIDEVLAVWDAEFQRKCLGRMEEVGAEGRTVLFVSHNMQAMLRLCPRVILLDHGHVIADGRGQDVVRTYLDSDLGTPAAREWTEASAPGDDRVKLKAVRVRTGGHVTDEVDIRRSVEIEVEYWQFAGDPDSRPTANLHLFNEDGVCLFVTSDQDNREWRDRPRGAGLVKSVCRIPGNFLAEGRVFVHVAVSTLNPTTIHALERDAVSFQVIDHSTGDAVRGEYVADWPGVVRPMLDWEIDFEPALTETTG